MFIYPTKHNLSGWLQREVSAGSGLHWGTQFSQRGRKWHSKHHDHRKQPSRAGWVLTPTVSSAHPLKPTRHSAKVTEGPIKCITLALEGSKLFQESRRTVTLNSGGLTTVQEVTWTLIKRIFKGSAASLENSGKPAREGIAFIFS